jgi:hypothetical protein
VPVHTGERGRGQTDDEQAGGTDEQGSGEFPAASGVSGWGHRGFLSSGGSSAGRQTITMLTRFEQVRQYGLIPKRSSRRTDVLGGTVRTPSELDFDGTSKSLRCEAAP